MLTGPPDWRVISPWVRNRGGSPTRRCRSDDLDCTSARSRSPRVRSAAWYCPAAKSAGRPAGAAGAGGGGGGGGAGGGGGGRGGQRLDRRGRDGDSSGRLGGGWSSGAPRDSGRPLGCWSGGRRCDGLSGSRTLLRGHYRGQDRKSTRLNS